MTKIARAEDPPARPATPARLRELPPFGEPDTPYPPRPSDIHPPQAEDPHGVYLPAPEAGPSRTVSTRP